MVAVVEINDCRRRELLSKVLLDFPDVLRKSTGILPYPPALARLTPPLTCILTGST
jgi:hypothetical protein